MESYLHEIKQQLAEEISGSFWKDFPKYKVLMDSTTYLKNKDWDETDWKEGTVSHQETTESTPRVHYSS